MQSATPHWAHSSSVIKAFKHPPPTAAAITPPTPFFEFAYVSAAELAVRGGGWVGCTGGAHVLSVVYLVPPLLIFLQKVPHSF